MQRSNKTAGKILITGNSSGAMGAVFGGFSVAAWYPITPSTSLVDALGDYAKELRVDKESGERNLRHRPGRGRDRRDWHGGRRGLGGRARDDLAPPALASR